MNCPMGAMFCKRCGTLQTAADKSEASQVHLTKKPRSLKPLIICLSAIALVLIIAVMIAADGRSNPGTETPSTTESVSAYTQTETTELPTEELTTEEVTELSTHEAEPLPDAHGKGSTVYKDMK